MVLYPFILRTEWQFNIFGHAIRNWCFDSRVRLNIINKKSDDVLDKPKSKGNIVMEWKDAALLF